MKLMILTNSSYSDFLATSFFYYITWFYYITLLLGTFVNLSISNLLTLDVKWTESVFLAKSYASTTVVFLKSAFVA